MEKIRVWGAKFSKKYLELGINCKLYFIVEKKSQGYKERNGQKKGMINGKPTSIQIPQKGLMGIEYERDHCQLLY